MVESHGAGGWTRRAFIVGGALTAVGGVAGYLAYRDSNSQRSVTAPPGAKANEVDKANGLFFRKDYRSARVAYLSLASRDRISKAECARSAAICSLQLGEPAQACQDLTDFVEASADDSRLVAEANAKCGNVSAAVAAFDRIPKDYTSDLELCEELAVASARTGDKANAWRFYRTIEQANPSGPAMRRLSDSGLFGFTSDFFGYSPKSLLNYARGAKDGAIDWGEGSLKGLWNLVRHPVDSVTSFAGGVAKIFSKENLKLLLSPAVLVSKLGDVAARVYWFAWESCKDSVAREYELDVNEFGAQQQLHEIAAGRMVGYVAPDLILLVLSAGAGVAAKARDAARVAEVVAATARAEEGIEKVSLIGRSATFLHDAEALPALRKVAWLEDRTWEMIRVSPRLEGRLEKVAGWISDIRDIPGAKGLVKCIVDRLHLLDEGYLFQLDRAAEYARKDELAEIGRWFNVDVSLPGKPVRRMWAEADLELKDRTLVETKFRSSPLNLDEKLHVQLEKYNRAVTDGQFTRIRLECSATVSKAVRDRCSMLTSPVEIVENIHSEAISPGG